MQQAGMRRCVLTLELCGLACGWPEDENRLHLPVPVSPVPVSRALLLIHIVAHEVATKVTDHGDSGVERSCGDGRG